MEQLVLTGRSDGNFKLSWMAIINAVGSDGRERERERERVPIPSMSPVPAEA